MRVALWCPPNTAIIKCLVIPKPLWSLQVALAHTDQKRRLCALCLCFLEVHHLPSVPSVYSLDCWHEVSGSTTWLSPLSCLSALCDPPLPPPKWPWGVQSHPEVLPNMSLCPWELPRRSTERKTWGTFLTSLLQEWAAGPAHLETGMRVGADALPLGQRHQGTEIRTLLQVNKSGGRHVL